MKAKANTVPVKPALDSVEVTFTADEAYWLVAVVGAQTDPISRGIYDALTDVIAKETGENKYLIYNANETARKAYKMASGNRKGYGEAYAESKPETISFLYDGVQRVVANSSIDDRNRLLRGFELKRGSVETNQFKSYHLYLIGT